MNYNHRDKNSSTIAIHVMCAIVFSLFSFCWLYFFQADVLMMAQHVLSKGVTHYNPLIGACVITLLLYLLQKVLYRFLKLKKRSHALTYLPSMLILALLSSIVPEGDNGVRFSMPWWAVLLILVVWGLMVALARTTQDVESDVRFGLFSRPMWINLLFLSLMMMLVAWVGNTNAVFHYRMKVERCLLEGEAANALQAGKRSLESDKELFMLRTYALAREHALGEHLFEYPITGKREDMLPTAKTSTGFMMYPVDSLYKFMGARPAGLLSPERYLQLLERRDTLPNKTVQDYLLCGYLIDRQIDQFANEIGRYYHINDSLPKHYREALTLYTHMRTRPKVVYHNAVMDEDYDNFQELERDYKDAIERKGKVEEKYRETYWYYYKYEK
jgi:hypothetical protein